LCRFVAIFDPPFPKIHGGPIQWGRINLYNINRSKLENLLHRFFSGARLEVQIDDRFGNPVKPREWFLVPLNVIDEVVGKIQEGTITNFRYDPKEARLVEFEG